MHGDLCKHLGIDSSTDHPDSLKLETHSVVLSPFETFITHQETKCIGVTKLVLKKLIMYQLLLMTIFLLGCRPPIAHKSADSMLHSSHTLTIYLL